MIYGLESPAGLPDEAELTRWANAIFKALPGLDGLGAGRRSKESTAHLCGAAGIRYRTVDADACHCCGRRPFAN